MISTDVLELKERLIQDVLEKKRKAREVATIL